MTADPTYLETLLLYYEEEVEGEAYFNELATRFEAPDAREKLLLLAEVERHAAHGVAPLLEQYDLIPRPREELSKMGRKDAQTTTVDWAELLAGMNKTYPGYLVSFHKLEAMAPAADLPRLSFLTEHEVAALKFLEIEAQDPAASAAPLRAYLDTDPVAWIARAG
ncbi:MULTISPECIES: hypothetical protein [unclassified Roseovarius]|uniref:hypothetical protein n=1 Tax=unclassified Roseovarius TaxID=2614913 RepID=UPI00273E3F14|nr:MULTISPECIES: hypothetical protein [unclassified Roseovarius]